MSIEDVELVDESQKRYLTYALSVVSSRALPDVRDGLKPVQRRILYAMQHNLHLSPEKSYRKSAAVVGEVLARYHPHGDSACYEAMVRMAQDFNFRYPLIDGQGNFGSLDGDSAAAYRYTEAKLTALALEVIGDIGQETVMERENFDQTVQEPVVLPSRVPNLLINGSSGIAVGMATAVPPHNLPEVVKALQLLIEDEEASLSKILGVMKGPDFPTACLILNTREELKEIYASGRGAIRMRADYTLEKGQRGKQLVLIKAIPYMVDKSVLVEKIADLIISRKVPQLVDIRDESTDEVRIVLELSPGGNSEKALAYLFKNTSLQQNFNVNLTALVPSKNPLVGRPTQLSLKEMLLQFIDFRLKVTRCKLEYEKRKLEERIHLLEGLVSVYDAIKEVIEIVRKSKGRADSASKLQKRFKLTEVQALFIVDLRIYQLSKTSIEDIEAELKDKLLRVRAINRILRSEKALKEEVSTDLRRVSEDYGDERRSKVVQEFSEVEFDKEEYVEHEEVFVVVTCDGWLKRIRTTNDPENTRIREGDGLFFVEQASTRDALALFSSMGNVFVTNVFDLVYTTGFGEPVQKMFRFQDGEQIVSCMLLRRTNGKTEEPNGQLSLFDKRSLEDSQIVLFTEKGFGFRLGADILSQTKKVGKRLVRLTDGDRLLGVCPIDNKMLLCVSEQGYGLCFLINELPLLTGAGKGVVLQKLPRGDKLRGARPVDRSTKVKVSLQKGSLRELSVSSMTIGSRAKRGLKIIKRGAPVKGLV